MPSNIVHVPAKTILFGEHAVVYGQPAIAVPVSQLNTTVSVRPLIATPAETIRFSSPEIELSADYTDLPANHPFRLAVEIIKNRFSLNHYPSCEINFRSNIPIGSGLGSSAAVAVALVRALSEYIGAKISNEEISSLAYEIEIAYHGTPSGIDNTVIAHNSSIFFQKGEKVQILDLKKPIWIVIGDSGIFGNTKEAVAGVRDRWLRDPDLYNQLFNDIGKIVKSAVPALKAGDSEHIGQLMNANHQLLQKIGVSHSSLDQLVNAARQAGALGSKMCGGGLGGNMIAITKRNEAQQIAEVLDHNGAVRTMITVVGQKYE